MNRIPASWALPPLLPVTQDGGGGARCWGRSTDVAWRTPARGWAAVGVAALMPAWPAFWNGYPLVFADTGTYLG